MELKKCVVCLIFVCLLLDQCEEVAPQSGIEFPVQLAFPLLVGITRVARFVKRMTYVLSPSTYRSRNRRGLISTESPEAEPFDAAEVEKYIVGEFGSRACVFGRVCAHYATRARAQPKQQMDWPHVFSQYKRSPDQTKDFYLLSVFLGDIVGSPPLCRHLAKRRNCEDVLSDDRL